jgi:hypothetical protein
MWVPNRDEENALRDRLLQPAVLSELTYKHSWFVGLSEYPASGRTTVRLDDSGRATVELAVEGSDGARSSCTSNFAAPNKFLERFTQDLQLATVTHGWAYAQRCDASSTDRIQIRFSGEPLIFERSGGPSRFWAYKNAPQAQDGKQLGVDCLAFCRFIQYVEEKAALAEQTHRLCNILREWRVGKQE